MPSIRSLMLVAVSVALAGRPGHTSVLVFSNLVEPGDQFGPDGVGIGHTPGFPNAGDYLIFAVRLVPSTTAVLRSFEAPIGFGGGPGNVNQFQAFFMSDAGGQPGNILESFTLTNLPNAPAPLDTIDSVLHPVVVAGQPYWFAATGGPEGFGLWTLTLFQGDSTSGGATRAVVSGVAGPWSVGTGTRTGALQVLGDPVPEASYSALVGCISSLFVLVRVLKSHQVSGRLNDGTSHPQRRPPLPAGRFGSGAV